MVRFSGTRANDAAPGSEDDDGAGRAGEAKPVAGVSDPTLRATTESGDVWDDPSEEVLFEILGEIEQGNELFVVVDRLADSTGQTYIQTIIEGGTFVIEHREGSADRHFRTVVPGRAEAYAVFAAWVYQLPGWRDALAWEPAALDHVAPGS